MTPLLTRRRGYGSHRHTDMAMSTSEMQELRQCSNLPLGTSVRRRSESVFVNEIMRRIQYLDVSSRIIAVLSAAVELQQEQRLKKGRRAAESAPFTAAPRGLGGRATGFQQQILVHDLAARQPAACASASLQK